MLHKRQFYFSDPVQLNDPYDCQISIKEALVEAIENNQINNRTLLKEKLNKLLKLKDLYIKIEKDIKNCGTLSLSKKNADVLMWSHYGHEHRGFCLGFELSDKFTKHNHENGIIGKSDVYYCEYNPFLDFFNNFGESEELPSWNEFWLPLLNLGLIAKSKPWEYENEVRVVRAKPGLVSFEPTELVEVIFGLRTSKEHEKEIRDILNKEEWQHIKYKRLAHKGKGFMVQVVDA